LWRSKLYHQAVVVLALAHLDRVVLFMEQWAAALLQFFKNQLHHLVQVVPNQAAHPVQRILIPLLVQAELLLVQAAGHNLAPAHNLSFFLSLISSIISNIPRTQW
jgi:hypothetical protein